MKNSLDATQRKGLVAALYSLGNILAASLIIGQVVSASGIRLALLGVGVVLFVATYLVATHLNQEERFWTA